MDFTMNAMQPSCHHRVQRIHKTPGERKIKAEVIDDGWMVGAAVSKLLIPGTEISLLLVSLRLFHMRDTSPCRLHPQSRDRPRRKASDIWHPEGERVCIETAKKRKTWRPLFHLHSTKNISLPARKDITLAWGSMRMAECQEESGMGKWEVEAT